MTLVGFTNNAVSLHKAVSPHKAVEIIMWPEWGWFPLYEAVIVHTTALPVDPYCVFYIVSGPREVRNRI